MPASLLSKMAETRLLHAKAPIHDRMGGMKHRLREKRTYLYLTISGNMSRSPFVAKGSLCPSTTVKRVCKPINKAPIGLIGHTHKLIAYQT
jgi:hypothetical protein